MYVLLRARRKWSEVLYLSLGLALCSLIVHTLVAAGTEHMYNKGVEIPPHLHKLTSQLAEGLLSRLSTGLSRRGKGV